MLFGMMESLSGSFSGSRSLCHAGEFWSSPCLFSAAVDASCASDGVEGLKNKGVSLSVS